MTVSGPPLDDYIRFLPEIIMTVAGTLIMIVQVLMRESKPKSSLGHFSLLALIAAMVATFFADSHRGHGILSVLSAYQYLNRERANQGEYYALLLFSVVGQCVMVAANELIMIFIGLEISSIATYILAGYLRDDKRNNESALKYFLLGSFATAFLLYGIAWIYGITGHTNLDQIRAALPLLISGRENLILIGTAAALMFVGFAFKVSAAPFQVWAPDVYQGAPAPVTLFMSAGPKAAAFAVFVRVFTTGFGAQAIADRWEPFVASSALATMFVGNFAALMQTNVKRLLAYSSIAHAGYIMVAIAARNQVGIAAVMFYLAAYALMNIGAFAVVTHFARQGEKYVNVDDLAGLGWKQPVTAALFAIFLLSLIGVPLTAGFFGKFYIFKAALDAHLIWLAVLGLLNSAVGAYYYLRIIVVMYMREPGEATESLQAPGLGIRTTLWIAALGTLLLGIIPSLLLSFATDSSKLPK